MTSSMESTRSSNSASYRSVHPSDYDEESGRNCSISVQAGRRKLLKLSSNSPMVLLFIALFSVSFIVGNDNKFIASFMSTAHTHDEFNLKDIDPDVGERRRLKALKAVRNEYENQIITASKLNENLESRNMAQRMMAAIKITWPECVNNHMTAVECKGYIDYDILNGKDGETELFTGQDKLIRTIIKGKRSADDVWYNAVGILMNDQDMVVGTQGDGQVYYGWDWEGSGTEATPEQQAEILPVIGVETTAGSIGGTTPTTSPTTDPLDPSTTPEYPTDPADPTDPNYNPQLDPTSPEYVAELDPSSPSYVPEADPLAEEYEPIILEDNIMVEGADIEGAIVDAPEAPIAGGIVTDGTAENDPTVDTTAFDTALEDYTTAKGIVTTTSDATPAPDPLTADGTATTTTDADGVLTADGTTPTDTDYLASVGITAGARSLPAFDCAGLTGFNCCLLIKMTVPDSDIYGKAIQCHLNYVEGSAKQGYMGNSRGKKVFIHANHNEKVSKIPKVVGAWPKGQNDIAEWIAEAGHEPAPVPPS